MKCPWWTPEVDDLLVRTKEMAGTEPEFAKRVFEDADAAGKDRFGVELAVKVKLVWLNDHKLGLLPAERRLNLAMNSRTNRWALSQRKQLAAPPAPITLP